MRLAAVRSVSSAILFSGIVACSAADCAEQLSAKFLITSGAVAPYGVPADPNSFAIEGPGGEIVIAALKKAGLEKYFEIVRLPWKRAQLTTQMTRNSLIFPFDRSAERENQYKWVALLGTLKCVALALDPQVNISTIEDLRKLRIGVVDGTSAYEVTLRLLGPDAKKNIEAIADEKINFKKLRMHRIDAWVTQDAIANAVAGAVSREEGISPPRLRKGVVLFEQAFWIAANKEAGDEDIAKIRDAIERFKRTAEYRAILEKHGLS